MKPGLIIADSGPIFSLAIINKLDLLTELFGEVRIPEAVWKEITLDSKSPVYKKIVRFFNDKIQPIPVLMICRFLWIMVSLSR